MGGKNKMAKIIEERRLKAEAKKKEKD